MIYGLRSDSSKVCHRVNKTGEKLLQQLHVTFSDLPQALCRDTEVMTM